MSPSCNDVLVAELFRRPLSVRPAGAVHKDARWQPTPAVEPGVADVCGPTRTCAHSCGRLQALDAVSQLAARSPGRSPGADQVLRAAAVGGRALRRNRSTPFNARVRSGVLQDHVGQLRRHLARVKDTAPIFRCAHCASRAWLFSVEARHAADLRPLRRKSWSIGLLCSRCVLDLGCNVRASAQPCLAGQTVQAFRALQQLALQVPNPPPVLAAVSAVFRLPLC